MTDLKPEDSEIKKRYLKRYRKNRALILRLNSKINNLNERMTSIRSPKLSDMPRGGTPITYADLVAEKTELEDRVKRLEDKGQILKREILEKIDEVEDTRYAEILESFFIECKELDDIAEENCYSLRHTIRLYSKAIKEVNIE